MNLYLDASALVKRYVEEAGSNDVLDWMDAAEIIGMTLVTRAEVAAAIMRASRLRAISPQEIHQSLVEFRGEWFSFQRLPVTEDLVARADRLACEFGLRGYDAVHLAAALTWKENLNFPVTLATFDKELADAARQSGLAVLPE